MVVACMCRGCLLTPSPKEVDQGQDGLSGPILRGRKMACSGRKKKDTPPTHRGKLAFFGSVKK